MKRPIEFNLISWKSVLYLVLMLIGFQFLNTFATLILINDGHVYSSFYSTLYFIMLPGTWLRVLVSSYFTSGNQLLAFSGDWVIDMSLAIGLWTVILRGAFYVTDCFLRFFKSWKETRDDWAHTVSDAKPNHLKNEKMFMGDDD